MTGKMMIDICGNSFDNAKPIVYFQYVVFLRSEEFIHISIKSTKQASSSEM